MAIRLTVIADFVQRRVGPATRNYSLILLYRTKDLGELRDSLSKFCRGEPLIWAGSLSLAILFPPFRPLFAPAIAMVCLSIAMLVASWAWQPIRFSVFMIRTIAYYATAAYTFSAITDMFDRLIPCLVGMIVHISAEATFFMRSRKLAARYAKLTPR